MPKQCTILVGSPDLLPALRERTATSGEVLSFSDAEPLAALEAITSRRPDVIALERLFAATSRGAALINRIKSDPALASAEIRVVSHDGEYSRVSRRRQKADAVAVEPPPPSIDYRGTRRAARVIMSEGTEARIDGAPAMLVNLSTTGAQVTSTSVLRPNQRVRVILLDEVTVVRFSGLVMWASLEMPKGVSRYRAGMEFQDADPEAIQAYLERHRQA